MSHRSLKDCLNDHYGGMNASPAVTDRLTTLADAEARGSGVVRGGSRWLSAGVAGCLVLLVTLVGLQVYQLAGRPTPTAVSDPSNWTGNLPLQAKRPAEGPRLVTVKFHIDGCPYSAETAPVFTELMDRYADKPVIFAKYDMTNERTLKQSRNLAEALGVEKLYQGPFQSGLIEVVDRKTGQVLATATKRTELEDLENVLDQALH